MLKFNEYLQIKFLVEEIRIPKKTAFSIINENFITDLAPKLASKYALPLAVVMGVLAGQGCSGTQCPTPQVQQQIKQDVSQEIQSYSVTSPDAAKFLSQNVDQSNSDQHNWTSPNAAKFLPDQQQSSGKQVAKDIIQIGPNAYEVTGYARTGGVMSPGMASNRADLDAKAKLAKYLKVQNLNLSQTGEVIKSEKNDNILKRTIRIELK